MVIDGSSAHGAALTERVIEAVRRDPGASALSHQQVPWVVGTPRPVASDVLAEMVFPSGRPLPPSLRAWLAFDVGLLERYDWFDEDGGFAPRRLDELVLAELGEPWAECYAPLAERFDECFLLPGGSDSRRFLAVGEPDSEGEYPVLALDVDDLPFVGLMYPGFDVYLADRVGLLRTEFPTYTALFDHAVYSRRLRQHARTWFAGEAYAEYPF
ncbi:hypothetical protein SAMN04244553_1506 [Nocardia amikacinitolerans]|uniref:SMI1 / KNR4 family (SUKH-1) n=1 Tax=Nocardia amikacinitolerans TaxID=756689 RepID=A0A285L2L3_9NOCA|nr:hypothetical protein [Nocardia amikacinitolerans]SNY79144.1 hypothetical protein SAMN04244553_1506 [Nocardia amikacinitolerans]